MSFPTDQFKSIFHNYPPPQSPSFEYGTAGFRMIANKLDSVMVSVAAIAIIRSLACSSQTIGIMITASHNPPHDNGVKLVDPLGDMLIQSWEPIVTNLANCSNYNDFESIIKPLWEKYYNGLPASLCIARDTRESGPHLSGICTQLFDSLTEYVNYENFNELTTPQLHYITRCSNDSSFGEPSVSGYFSKLSNSLLKLLEINNIETSSIINIIVDSANGVGATQLDAFLKSCPILSKHFTAVNTNVTDPTALNVNCGADYVKTNQDLPRDITKSSASTSNTLCASFDGDADRLVCYFQNETQFNLLDGDKIATLFTNLISHLINQLPPTNLKIGIIQTAYANGASTNYITDKLKVPVVCAKTGVKHLHHEALNFDIGVYFEANGHGTVLFSDNFRSQMNIISDHPAARSLLLLNDLINQTVGDALSDLLAVVAALSLLHCSPQEWTNSYIELPNKLAKVIVKDRNAFVTTDAERQLVAPQGVQSTINEIVSRFPNARAFVRPSGTEDAVRVYAEAATLDACLEVVDTVVALVKESAV